jgi:potassium-transporting ATPase KdpC subunit
MNPEFGKEMILEKPQDASDRDETPEEGSAPPMAQAVPSAAAISELALSDGGTRQLRPAILSALILSMLTGLVFPVALAVPGWLLFPHQAGGSLVVHRGVVVGSRLIGQASSQPGYFHPRPSAAGDGYDGLASGGTNLGPGSPKLVYGSAADQTTAVNESFAGIVQLAREYRLRNGLSRDTMIPIDAVTRSGSGLDPHISPENAALQVARVARERGLSQDRLHGLIARHTLGRQLGFLGNPRVSVLELNLALEQGGK